MQSYHPILYQQILSKVSLNITISNLSAEHQDQSREFASFSIITTSVSIKNDELEMIMPITI